MITKIGRLGAQTRQELEMEGSSRSERRLMRGPELGLGAAMRVRWAGRRAGLKGEDCRRRHSGWLMIKLCQLCKREPAFCGGILSWEGVLKCRGWINRSNSWR